MAQRATQYTNGSSFTVCVCVCARENQPSSQPAWERERESSETINTPAPNTLPRSYRGRYVHGSHSLLTDGLLFCFLGGGIGCLWLDYISFTCLHTSFFLLLLLPLTNKTKKVRAPDSYSSLRSQSSDFGHGIWSTNKTLHVYIAATL